MGNLNENEWRQISGDMDPACHGGIFARLSGDSIELLELDQVRDHESVAGAQEVGFPFWMSEGYYDPSDLEWDAKDTPGVLSYVGEDETKERWEETPPEQRAVMLFEYGSGKDHTSGGYALDIFPSDRVVGWGSEEDIRLDFLAVDDEFLGEVMGKVEFFRCSVGVPTQEPHYELFLVRGRRDGAEWAKETLEQETEAKTEHLWCANPFKIAFGDSAEAVLVEPFSTLEHDNEWVLSDAADALYDHYNGKNLRNDLAGEVREYLLNVAEKQSELRPLVQSLLKEGK